VGPIIAGIAAGATAISAGVEAVQNGIEADKSEEVLNAIQ
jgi:hypothetical protein